MEGLSKRVMSGLSVARTTQSEAQPPSSACDQGLCGAKSHLQITLACLIIHPDSQGMQRLKIIMTVLTKFEQAIYVEVYT